MARASENLAKREAEATHETGRRSRRRQRRRRQLGVGLIGLSAALVGFYNWQAWRWDFIPRRLPNPNPRIDPDSARLFASGTKVAVVTAHPDDAEFYIGGLLARLAASGAKLSLVVATDGDKGYYPFEDAERNRRVRRQEQLDAARIWNCADVTFLAYPDGRVSVTDEFVERIARELTRIQPDYILLFDGDYPPSPSHRDHRATGVGAEQAIRQAKVGTWALHFSTLAANYAVDITDQWPQKQKLLAVHASQFTPGKMPRIVGIVGASAVNDGKMLGVRYAEGLRCERLR